MGNKVYRHGISYLFIVSLLFTLLMMGASAGSVQADIDPDTVQKLVAGDKAADDQFGWSVSVDGDTVLIGAYKADPEGSEDAGAAYIFIRSDGIWTQQAKLTADDRAAEDRFGWSISVDGDTAVIGTPRADPEGSEDAGAVYVFTRSDGIWTQQAKLTADDKAAEDQFGWSVSVDGDTVLIGVPGADPEGIEDAGAVYVFTRSDGIWTQQAKLTAADKAAEDWFGISIFAAGDTAVVGAPGADPEGTGNAGAVYVFTRSDEIWTQQAKLTADDKAADDQFGWSISVDGDTAVIGTYGADPDDLDWAGAAYIFTRSGELWTQQTKLTAPDKAVGDGFGSSVSVDGDTAVIGAPGADPDDLDWAGAAYIFIRSGELWTQQTKLTAPDKAVGDLFGSSVSVAGDTAVIGAYGADPDDLDWAGAAYLFSSCSNIITVDAGGTCTLAHAIIAANTDAPSGGCPAGCGDDTITLETDITLTVALPEITSAITIEGQGHTIDGNGGDWSVLTITEDGDVTLNETAVTGANHISGGGGGLFNVSTLTLNDSTIRDNSTALTGGGIYSLGTLILNNSTVSGNSAGGSGGGIDNASSVTTVVLSNSTVSDNEAGADGGGIVSMGPVTLTSCTVSENHATLNGGGIYGLGVITLTGSILSGNIADSSGNEVCFNTSGGGASPETAYNLFGHSGETDTEAFYNFTLSGTDITATSDGTNPATLSSILSPLADNGGPTKTHALVPGSPALDLDADCSTGLDTDQRGEPRPLGAGCDAGAFEGSIGDSKSTAFLPAIYFLLLNK